MVDGAAVTIFMLLCRIEDCLPLALTKELAD